MKVQPSMRVCANSINNGVFIHPLLFHATQQKHTEHSKIHE